MRISLTFDNGPHRDVTPVVLDTLAQRGISATFFVLGKKLADPELYALASRALADGHRLGNHTYTHKTPLGLLADADARASPSGRRPHRPQTGGTDVD